MPVAVHSVLRESLTPGDFGTPSRLGCVRSGETLVHVRAAHIAILPASSSGHASFRSNKGSVGTPVALLAIGVTAVDTSIQWC